MKTRFFLILSVAISIGAAFWVQAQTPEPTPNINIVLPDSIYVRSGPGMDFEPVGALFNGTSVRPLNQSEDGRWILIAYLGGYGWINRELVRWVDDLETLPVLPNNALTPTVEPGSETATPFLTTPTPNASFIQLTEGSDSVLVRSGPSLRYLPVGLLMDGDVVEPVGRSEDSQWILIRTNDGFGWVAENLAFWRVDLRVLPVLMEDNLTPTATFTPSDTPTATYTPSLTFTPSDTPTSTRTPTATATPTATVTQTSTPSATPTLTLTPSRTPTATQTPTATPTPTATFTATITPSDTPTVTFTATETPSVTATITVIPTTMAPDGAGVVISPTGSDTVIKTLVPTRRSTHTPSATSTNTPTHTPTLTGTATNTPSITPTYTHTPSSTPTATATSSHTPTATATNTYTPTLTDTVTASPTDTATPSDTPTATTTPTATPTETQVMLPLPEPTDIPPTIPAATTDPDEPDGGIQIPSEAILGLLVLLAVLGYVIVYLRGLADEGRYQDGFVVEHCPVCRKGNLHVETRRDRMVGVPRIRHTVRCDNCRSVLRETGMRRWRYAVDRIENAIIFDRYNGKEITDDELKTLAERPISTTNPLKPPEFVDDVDAR